jgi:predicted dehydrogenase
MSNENMLRWGILGTAEIARKNWKAIRNSGNGIVTAVASRDVGRARRFIGECQAQAPFDSVPRALGGYESLLAAKDVDAVYIPLPTGLRKEWVIRAAEAGKHVICEKPCANSVPDLREMLAACRSHGVQFMDGVMFMHSRRLDAIRQMLDGPDAVGQIRRLAFGFSFGAPEEFFTGNIRADRSLEPQGCLGDLGWYCIRFALWVMRGQLPTGVTGRILSGMGAADGSTAAPSEFSAEMFFDGGVSAGFYCSFITELQQWAHISGTKGSVRIGDFVLPDFGNELTFEVSNPFYRVSGCDFNMEPNSRRVAVPEYSNSHPSAQESNLFRNFTAQVRSAQISGDWSDIALKTQQVMDACLASARAGGGIMPVA